MSQPLRRISVLAVVLLLGTGAPTSTAASRCGAKKAGATAGYLAALSRCMGKAVRKAAEPDPLCLAKAEAKLAGKLERAERGDDCPTVGDLVPLQDVLDDGVGAATDVLETADTSVCCQSPGYCVWTEDDQACTTLFGGTPGPPGSACDGFGACVATAPTVGNCCSELPDPFACAASPAFHEQACDTQGGIFSGGTLCDPTGQCMAVGERPASRCTAKKHRALAGYAKRMGRCQARAVKKELPVEPVCVAAAQSRLLAAWGRAEKRDDCIATAEAASARDAVDDALLLAFEILDPPPGLCCGGMGACAWLDDADSCTALGGTPGAPGTVCDAATGSCAAPPGGDGPCCEGSQLGGETTCEAGPNVDGLTCAAHSGSLLPDAVCVSARLCID